MMIGISEQCRNRWLNILPHFGVRRDEYLTGKQGPCPACGGKDRFRFDNLEGRGTYFCNQCGSGDGVMLVMLVERCSFREAAEKIREIAHLAEPTPPPPTQSEQDRQNAVAAMWKSGKVITQDDDAGRYLMSRGIAMPFSPALRFVPKIKVTGDDVAYLPAMIAAIRSPDGRFHNIHRTYLQNGRKAAIKSPRRIMAGSAPAGSYIPLAGAADEMGVAEGIETALRASRRFGIPVWSVISANGLKAFTPPIVCTRLHIFGDNDLNFTGQAAAYALANRLAIENDHITCSVEIPTTPGTDWADDEPLSTAA